MRVTAVETFLSFVGWRNWLLVKVSTDEGIVGWGEATTAGRERTVAAAVEHLSEYLIGRDPTGIEAHWWGMYRGTSRWRGGVILNSAIAGIEAALWDIEGKRLGVPVYRLLGGPIRERVRAYANRWFVGCQEPEEYAERALQVVEAGFTAMKWGPFGRAGTLGERESINRAVKNVEAVRRAVGPDVDLAIEGGDHFLPRNAIDAARALEPYGIFWLEEPVPFENSAALARVARKVNVPIATGERLLHRWEFRELLEQEAAEIVQPDLTHCGGILEGRKIAALAETYQVQFAPHNSGGPIQTLMSLHVCATAPNALILETFVSEAELRDRVCTRPLQVENGSFALPTEPGLGTDILIEELADHPFKQPPLESYFQFRQF